VRRLFAAALVALVGLAGSLGACSSDGSSSEAAQPEPSAAPSSPVKSLSMLPMPEKTLSGTLTADLQQSSRDVALGRFQVWVTNGLDHGIEPRRIVYDDRMLSRPVVGGRLRSIPSGAYRGFTLDLVEPRCGAERGEATVTVSYGDKEESFPVEDETGVVERWSHERCDEIAVEQVAELEWTGVTVTGSGSDAEALFELTATPTGRDGMVTVDTVGGTPLFTSAEGSFWTVGQRVRGDGEKTSMLLAAQPARCDSHAFGAAGGGTTFFVNLTIGSGEDAREAQIRLAMSPEVTADAFAFAGEVCGWEG